MTTFNEREKSFEKKFQRDQELAFKAKARRNKLLGLWAAARMGLKDEAADTYAGEVVSAALDHPGDDGVVEKVTRDLAAKGIKLDAYRVREELRRCAEEARKQLGVPS